MLHVSVVDHANTPVLLRCLAMLPAACAGLEWELTVIENLPAGDPEAVRAAVPPGTRIIENPAPLGFGANHNQALRPLLERPEVEWALVLNDDTEPPAASIAALVDCAAAHPEAGAVSPRLAGDDGAAQRVLLPFPTPGSEFLSVLTPTREPRVGGGQGWLNGACLLLRVEALRRVGIFDERFFLFYEDTDLGARLRDGGWSRLVCDGVEVVHTGHGTVGRGGVAMERHVARSRHLYVEKHFGGVAAALLRTGTRGAYALRAAKAALQGQRDHAAFLRALATYDPRQAP